MHMVIKNTLYPSILSPIIPYPYLFCVGEGEEASTSACFHQFFSTNKKYVKIKLMQNETNLWTILLVKKNYW